MIFESLPAVAGQCALSCVYENHNLIATIEDDLTPAFLLADHAALWEAAVEIHAEGLPLDGTEWPIKARVDPAYIGILNCSGAVLALFPHYVRDVRKFARDRRKALLLEDFLRASDLRQLEITRELERLLTEVDDQASRSIFHSYDETINAPPVRFGIDGFFQDEAITILAGLPGASKTWCMLAMIRALLEGSKLFDYFSVPAKSDRVIYLIPEAGLGPFAGRLKAFHLREHVQTGHLLYRTLSGVGRLELNDPRLLRAVHGAYVFLDSATRFMYGNEDAENSRIFADNCFALLRAEARGVCAVHHSPKYFGRADQMTLENVLRGSGDLGAMASTCWGFYQIDAEFNRIFVQNVKARDFAACKPFIIQGRPSIDERGSFVMPEPPGFAGELSEHKQQGKSGRL